MKKLILLLLCVITLLLLSAQGETYSAPGDVYYHQHTACALGNGLAVVDSTNELFPCPICADDHVVHEEPEAFILGDTVIIRMPDKWMRERPDIGTVFASWDKDVYSGNEADKLVSEMLHGAEYRAFLDSDDAVAYVYSPGIYAADRYSQRHIGDSWYVTTYLPENVPEDIPAVHEPYRDVNTWHGYLRFFGGRMWKRDGLVMYYEPAEWGDVDYSITLNSLDNTPVYVAERDGYSYSLYPCEDVFLCVINGIPSISDEMDYYQTFLIDGMPVCTDIKAYDNKYCFTLTAGEVYRLKNGNTPSLFNGAYSYTDFGQSEFAVFNADYGWAFKCRTGVVDKNGNEVLPERCFRISRYGDRFFCRRSNREAPDLVGIYVYDMGISDEPVYEYFEKDAKIYFSCANGSVFILEWNELYDDEVDKLVVCDMQSGEILGSIPMDFGSGEEYPYDRFNAEYVWASGQPQRLCLMAETDAYLMDNGANVIARFEGCAELWPLIWNDGKGLFLAIYGEDAEYCLSYSNEMLLHGFDAGYYIWGYGEYDENDPWNWEFPEAERELEESDIRFGLIKENGEAITEFDYTYIRVLSDTQIELGKRDGTRFTVNIGG